MTLFDGKHTIPPSGNLEVSFSIGNPGSRPVSVRVYVEYEGATEPSCRVISAPFKALPAPTVPSGLQGLRGIR